MKTKVIQQHGAWAVVDQIETTLAVSLHEATAQSISKALNLHDDLAAQLGRAIKFFDDNGGNESYTWLEEMKAVYNRAKYE